MIGIITSGTENYNLIKLCHMFDLPYCIIADTDFWPYQDKKSEIVLQRIESLLQLGKEKGCTHFLLNPVIELYYTHILHNNENILPLFSNYIDHCFEGSLIGKIWYIGGYTDIELINTLHQNITNHYSATDKQLHIKNFQLPLAKRTKDISMRTFFSRFYGNRTMMINKIIKFDLRYFKDANVDTLIPLSYDYFNYQRTISSFFNPKKQKFHKRDVVINLFKTYLTQHPIQKKKQTDIRIYTTGSSHLLNNKKWEIIASHGWIYNLVYDHL